MTSRAIPGKSVIMADNLSGESFEIGVFDCAIRSRENRMRPVLSALDGRGAALMGSYAALEDEFVTLDEIGYLETQSENYCRAILNLMDRRRVAAVVRRQNLPFLTALCARSDVFLLDLDDPFGQIGCVIMASGMGVRFGANKLMADFGGRPMLAWAIDATARIFCGRVVVTRHEAVQRLCDDFGVSCVLHDCPHASDTVRIGLETLLAAGGDLQGCLFCPGDQPLLTRDTVAALALCAKNDPDSIWRPAYEGTPGSPVFFPKGCFESLRNLPQGSGGSAVIRRHSDLVRLLPIVNRWELEDADTPEALDILAQKI